MIPLFRPTALRARLEALGLKPNKRLSQNFLIDGNIIRKIVETANVRPGDCVVEIGPGPGALTQALLEAGAHVIAIEKDRGFAAALSDLQTADKRLEVIEADVLDVSLEKILSGKKAKVVANLPYHITTPILTRLAPQHALIEQLTLMVQKEVAERMAARAGTAAYGSLTLYLQFYGKIENCFTIAPTSFYPSPSVQSAIVRFTPKPAGDGESLFALTRAAFQKRRKMLTSSLQELHPKVLVAKALSALSLSPMARPEELTLEQFIALERALSSSCKTG
jgi:16S rRNA (adenine1518-N6/adenine1519-N6)-dimethyltransferase